jgi:GTPase SAR1 family protein
MDVRLKHPFTCTVAGPTSSGKTQFVFRLIRHANELTHPPPERILYCYGEFQPSFLELPQVEFHEGLPDVNRFDGRHRILLIIDDLINEVNQNVCNIFTKLSHHRNVSVIFLTQDLFHRNKHVRTMNLNTHYIVLFKNPRDAGQVSTLARQMYPGKSKFVVEAYEDVTKETVRIPSDRFETGNGRTLAGTANGRIYWRHITVAHIGAGRDSQSTRD